MFAAGKAASGAEPTDAQFNYVTMLLHGNGTNGAQNNTFLDSSTNNFTITRNGNITQGTFTPYGSNWSNYFNGSSDYLTVASNAAFQFGTGDFTIEFWFYMNALTGGNQHLIDMRGASFNALAPLLYVTSGGVLYYYTAGTNQITGATLSVGQWYHIALARSGTSTKLFVNGAQSGSTLSDSTNYIQSSVYIGRASDAAGGYVNGYESNVRLVKGTAVYTSAFTPSTTPLTAITNTQLLTCQSNRFIDNSSNAFTVTPNGSPSVQRFSPFSPTSAYSTSVIGGSGYFDKSGDYLDAGSNSAFAFGTGAYTVECWLYISAASGVQNLFCNNTTNGFDLYLNYSNSTTRLELRGGANIIAFSYVPPANQWVHLALVRSGTGTNQTVLYANGVSQGSGTDATNWTVTGAMVIGGLPADTVWLGGYMSDARLVKGTAVYTSTFTPPTAPLTAIANTSLLLSYTNAAISDNAMMNDLETVGNAQISTSVKKYGTGSMYFDGTGDYISTVYKPIAQYGSANFTIEFWFYQNSRTAGEYDAIFRINSAGTGYGADMYMTIGAGASGYALTVSNNARNGWAILLNPTGGLPALTTWHHMAIVRNGSTWTVYLNGSSVGTATYSGTVNTPSGAFEIGWAGTSDSYFDGYIDDFRITNGVARYTTTFTPPTAAFPDKG